MPSQNNENDKPQQRAEYSWESLQARRNLTRDVNAEDIRRLSLDTEEKAPVYPSEIEDSDPGTCCMFNNDDNVGDFCSLPRRR
jgi:hypothetical protein